MNLKWGFLSFYAFLETLTLYSKFKVALGTIILLVSDSIPERTIQTLAEVVVPLLLGTITIR